MKILLTGYKGFIGSRMLKALEKDHKVVGYDWGEEGPFITPDIDWIIHLGAISSTTETDIDKLIEQNFEFSVMLYERSSEYNTNFQFASSASLYGMGTEFAETSPVDPRNGYALTKHLFESYVNSNPKENRICQIFRYFNVYGEGEEHKGSQASPYTQFKKQALETGKIKVFEGSENYRRDFVPVEKVVETHLKFLNVKESGVWNIGTGTATSFMEIAESFNVPIETIPMPQELAQSYQKYTCADLTKLNKTLESL
jgi:ADP-L-glycero-D-manno-heptose 6-epimerase